MYVNIVQNLCNITTCTAKHQHTKNTETRRAL